MSSSTHARPSWRTGGIERKRAALTSREAGVWEWGGWGLRPERALTLEGRALPEEGGGQERSPNR